MTRHAFGAKVTETSVGKCFHVRLYYTVLYCVERVEKGIQGLLDPRQWEGNKTSGCFYLTVWNPANFVGGSSKSHIFSELFREAGTSEDFPI